MIFTLILLYRLEPNSEIIHKIYFIQQKLLASGPQKKIFLNEPSKWRNFSSEWNIGQKCVKYFEFVSRKKHEGFQFTRNLYTNERCVHSLFMRISKQMPILIIIQTRWAITRIQSYAFGVFCVPSVHEIIKVAKETKKKSQREEFRCLLARTQRGKQPRLFHSWNSFLFIAIIHLVDNWVENVKKRSTICMNWKKCASNADFEVISIKRIGKLRNISVKNILQTSCYRDLWWKSIHRSIDIAKRNEPSIA